MVQKQRGGLGGTSAAAPFVAGLITVMQALNPDLNPHTVGMSDAQKSAIVPRIRAILTDDDINFTNADLVALGFSDQPVVRRRLVNPLAAVQAAADGVFPELAALGYDTSLNFSELLVPNDTPAQALPLVFNETETGSLIALRQAGSIDTPIDNDWFRLVMPAAPANRIYETAISLRYRGDETRGSASLEGDNISWLSAGGGAERIRGYRLFAPPSATPLVNVTGSRSVYKLTVATPQLAVPLVAITQPTAAEICAGPVPFAATASYRGTTTFSVPASAFVWTVSGIGPIGTGPLVTANLTPGTYTVTLTLFGDPAIADTRSLTVIDCIGFSPVVTITAPIPTPGEGGDVVYDNFFYDRELSLFYIDIAFAGIATDPEDGTLTGAALTWTTDRSDLQAAALGSGTALTARLYAIGGCINSHHEITLAATDSNGNISQVTQRIRLVPLC